MSKSNSIQIHLQQLKQQLFDLSSRNPLVNVLEHQLWKVGTDEVNAEKIYKKQQFFIKEYALQTTLLVSHFIKWKHPNKDKFYTSPLFIVPCKIIKNQKINLTYHYEQNEDNFTINPVLKNEFKTLFNIDFNPEFSTQQTVELLINQLESNGSRVHQTNHFSALQQWEIITLNAIGTFNYKKAVLAQDYDSIITHPNPTVLQLLGEGKTNTQNDVNIKVVNVNQSQQKAIESCLIQNTVIQGPPGTGKSNTIVELIKNYLIEDKKVLFVSEKKSALDVVYQKLKQEELNGLLAYFDGTKQQKKQFYQHLKLTLSLLQSKNSNRLSQKKIQKTELEAFFNAYQKLNSIDASHNISLKQLLDELIQNQNNLQNGQPHSSICAYNHWNKYLVLIEDIENIAIKKFKVKFLNQLSFINLNKAVFTQNNPIDILSKRLNELQTILTTFLEIDGVYNLNWSWSDWSKHSIAASVLQMANQKQLELLDPKSKKYKSFNNWTKKYDLLKHKLNIAETLVENWKIKPKFNQIDALLDELKNIKPNFFNKFKKSNVKIAFKNYKLKVSSNQQLVVLNQLKNYYQLKHQFEEIKLKLKHHLNILNPDIEINQLMAMRQKLETNSHQQYVFLLEHQYSLQLIQDLHQLQPKIQKANQIKRFLFYQFEDISIKDLKRQINLIKQDLPLYNYYLPEIKQFLGLPSDVLNFIKQNSLTSHQLNGLVLYNTYNHLLKFEPYLKDISGQKILDNFKLLKQAKSNKNKQLVDEIIKNKQNHWQEIEQLLLTPSSKLKPAQKTLKKLYKQSKKIIYHESVKQQQHLPIKSLIEQTSPLIFNVLPLWIMNPLTIAESLPCEKDMFDVVIFDEASQIPLEDSLPAVFRAKKIIVVGDNKQMPPSQFFTHAKETVSLLMEAEVNLHTTMLTTHYRSHHPKLMEFSNVQFYDNELNYFPPATIQPPFILNYVKQGRFENGKNIIEAKAVALTYQQYLKKGKKDVGIVAFSKEQEQAIRYQINALNLPQNDELLIRNLENTQGIEKEYMIISIGYGFTKEGKFRQHFGPLNQAYGANRLNVMLTRAQKQITVCTSIKPTDFKFSDNNGVNLLKDFLQFVEQNHQTIVPQPELYLFQIINNWLKNLCANQNLDIKYYQAVNGQMINAFIDKTNQKILLIDPCLNKNETKDIYTLLDVLQERFSKVKVALSKDYFENETRLKTDVIKFFVGETH